MEDKNGALTLVGEIELLRLRVATAESAMKVLREQAREARRRQKEAKRFARQARKLFKRSKAETARLTKALAEAETRLFRAASRALSAKLAKASPSAKGKRPVTRRARQTTEPRYDGATVVVSRRTARQVPAVQQVDSTLETPRLRYFPRVGSLRVSNLPDQIRDL